MKIEKWKFVPGYEGLYMVSNFGRVKSLDIILSKKDGKKEYRKGRILKPAVYGSGYLRVGLCKNGQHKLYLVHRLVALAFIPNPDNLPQVNHINEDKTDNRVENLEWCTAAYNLKYGSHNEKVSKARINGKLAKKVNQYTLEGILVTTWPSASEITRVLNYNQGFVSGCCRGVYNQAYGYLWSYQD